MAYDTLIDHIIKEAEGKKEEILSEARKKADAMLSDLDKRRGELRERAFRGLELELEEYRVKEINRAHLKCKAILTLAKEKVIEDLHRDLYSALKSIEEGPSYPAILRRLLIEGFKELKGKVFVLANSRDCQLIKDFLKDANLTCCEVVSVSPDDRVKGGIEILAHDKSISITNTIWSRFEKVKEDLMPEVGQILFPPSSSLSP